MKRREFITGLGVAAAWPVVAWSQQPGRTYRLGFFMPVSRQETAVVAFFDELRRGGFVEGQNLEIIGGFDIGNDRIAEHTALLAKAAPDAIVSAGVLATRALQQAAPAIPLLAMSEDMLADGLVDSLARPGGNTTGISMLSLELDGKRQDILTELVPGARCIAALYDTNITTPRHVQELHAAARARNIELLLFGVARPEETAPAIDAAKAAGAEAINVLATPLLGSNGRVVFERVTALRLPAIYQWPELAEAGGLVGYGPRRSEIFRQRARLVVKVLRGGKPADIPVEQPTRFDLVINLKAAKIIGHEVPARLVLRADQVIE
jgi:putative ABC transport system substrate-binding protein